MGGKGSVTLLFFLINQLMIEVFVEQPLALPGSAKYFPLSTSSQGLFFHKSRKSTLFMAGASICFIRGIV